MAFGNKECFVLGTPLVKTCKYATKLSVNAPLHCGNSAAFASSFVFSELDRMQ